MKPYLSIIIPYYNAPEKVDRLLSSIQKSKHAPLFEVIVVDDGSDGNAKCPFGKTQGRPMPNVKWRNKERQLRCITLENNSGPAVARNRGAAKAKGTILVFLDCDVEVFPDTLFEIGKIFQGDPDLVALTGVWVKEQKTDAFFPNFKALRDWSYWVNERDKNGYYFLFSTRIAAMKRSVFERLGGFDEAYPAPLVEDIELTYRIARRYAIIFAPTVRVRHEFEGFLPVAKKYFWRSFYWTKLYQNRKKFDPVATTLQEAVTTITGVGVVFFFVGYLGHVGALGNLFFLTLAVHLFFIRKFLLFVYREKGVVFAVKSFFVGLILYCVIFAGAVWGRLSSSR